MMATMNTSIKTNMVAQYPAYARYHKEIVCHESDTQLMREAWIGGKLRATPVHGTFRDPKRIPVYKEGSAYYTYAEYYRREYYIGVLPLEDVYSMVDVYDHADLSRIGEGNKWREFPTTFCDDPDNIKYEYHWIEKISVIFYSEPHKK